MAWGVRRTARACPSRIPLSTETVDLTYVLPIRSERSSSDELHQYLRWLADCVQLVIVDASPAEVFARNARLWNGFALHLPPDPDRVTPMGKVGSVLTGVQRAVHERIVIADDDVRYDERTLAHMATLLDHADVVRPQNFFRPLPWHARIDTAHTLLNRVTGGDWPGTLGVRRSVLQATDGYAGDVMFENLELVRTVRAAGGVERIAYGLYVHRLPPSTRHFWGQRVRQAYDEFARPARFGIELALLPLGLALASRRRWDLIALGAASAAVAAEIGRRRAGGRAIFPASAAMLAPVWLLERAVTSWLAVGARLRFGGIPYGGTTLRRAATPLPELRRRHRAARELSPESRRRSA